MCVYTVTAVMIQRLQFHLSHNRAMIMGWKSILITLSASFKYVSYHYTNT